MHRFTHLRPAQVVRGAFTGCFGHRIASIIILGLILAILSLILAILGLFLAILSLILAILGLVLAILGLILAILGLVLAILGLILAILGLRGPEVKGPGSAGQALPLARVRNPGAFFRVPEVTLALVWS